MRISQSVKLPIMVGPYRSPQVQKCINLLAILNDVKQIKAQDYYAPIVGEFEHFVLLALLRLGNGAYGASIRREIRDRTGRDASVGTVYMTLGRLEAKKMIVAYVGIPTPQRGGRAKRYFSITTAGLREVRAAKKALTVLWRGIPVQEG